MSSILSMFSPRNRLFFRRLFFNGKKRSPDLELASSCFKKTDPPASLRSQGSDSTPVGSGFGPSNRTHAVDQGVDV